MLRISPAISSKPSSPQWAPAGRLHSDLMSVLECKTECFCPEAASKGGNRGARHHLNLQLLSQQRLAVSAGSPSTPKSQCDI